MGWDALYKVGSHHYADLFCKKGYDLCWVTHPISPFHRFHKAYKAFSSEINDKYRVWKSGGVQHDHLLQYTPLTLLPYGNVPFLKSELVIKNMLRFTVPPLQHYLRKKHFNEVDILWFTNPALSTLRNMVTYKHCVFRIPDDTSAFETIPESIQRIERNLVETADVVFVTSRSIQERYSWAGDKIHYLPNGVDFEHFQITGGDVPEEYRAIPAPRIIYIGAIAEWFDIDMMEAVATTLKGYSFILIGQPRIDISRLRRLRNIFPLGGINYTKIPAYIKNSDVGIIPFKKSRLVDSVNPIKLYEYMACGLPVVATRWRTLEDIKSPAFLADSTDQFVAQVEHAVQSRNKGTYVEFARMNSWGERFKDIMNALEGQSEGG
jgi:glycosyltransferase involved in cell wall biosynthesis